MNKDVKPWLVLLTDACMFVFCFMSYLAMWIHADTVCLTIELWWYIRLHFLTFTFLLFLYRRWLFKFTFSMFCSQYSALALNRRCFLVLPSWYAGILSEVYIKILVKLVCDLWRWTWKDLLTRLVQKIIKMTDIQCSWKMRLWVQFPHYLLQ